MTEATKAGRVQPVDNDGNILGGSADKPIFVEDHLTSIAEGDVANTDSCIGSSIGIGTGAYVILSNCVAIQPSDGGQVHRSC